MFDFMILVFIYLCVSFLFIMFFAFLQCEIPLAEMPTSCLSYSTIAIIAICIQAIVSVSVFAGSQYFPFTAVFLAFTLLMHHAIIHRHSTFEGERCSCAPFQLKDVCNHETWVVCSIVASLISWFGV